MTYSSFRFGTVGSPISTPKKPGGSVGGVLRVAELNLSALELGWVRSVRVSEETCESIKTEACKNDVELSVHAPYYINLNAMQDEWPKSRKRLMDAAYFGNLAGASDIIFHPGSYFGKAPEEVLPLVIDRLQGCIDELRSEGNMVILRPETMGKSAMLGSLDDTLKMSKAIDGVEPCLDFAHLHARPGDGSMNSYDEWRKIMEEYAEALNQEALKNLHIHLSGIEYTSKGEKEHLPLLESDFDLDALLMTLVDFDCGGRIVCESPLLEEDALIIQEKWRDLSREVTE
jgi:deoxyribonuclease-4